MNYLAPLLSFLLTIQAFSQDAATTQPSTIANVSNVMQRFVQDNKVAGAVTMISHRGKIVHFSASGFRDIENKLPMQRDTIVRIYSMSKPITTVAAMILVEQGKLDLDAPIATYLPRLDEPKVYLSGHGDNIKTEPAKRAPTIRDLMRHTSGFTYGFFGDSVIDKMYVQRNIIDRASSLEDMIAKLSKMPLLHQPGTKFSYSVSTDVLGRVIEVVSGKPLDDFFDTHIFAPLQMTDTGFFVPAEKANRFATVYSPTRSGGLTVNDEASTSPFNMDPNFLSGGGGLVSTAADYMKFCQMMLNEGELNETRILKAETIRDMTQDQLSPEAFPIGVGTGPKRAGVGFGLGFSVVAQKVDNPFNLRVGEYGWGGAASTHFWISKRDELAVVVLTQLRPYSSQMEAALKSVIYEAIE